MKKTLGSGRFLSLVDEDGWEFVERKNASGVVAIAAVTGDGRLVLVEQFRRPVGKQVIELPAGLCGDDPAAPNEAASKAARRELLEETGYQADHLQLLFDTPPSAGLTSEVITVFGARGVTKVAAGGGIEGENITVHAIALDEVGAWLHERAKNGALIDAKIFLGLHFARS